MKNKICLIILILVGCSKEPRTLSWKPDTNVVSWDVYIDKKFFKRVYAPAIPVPNGNIEVTVMAIGRNGSTSAPVVLQIRGKEIIRK
jgi:hypothetical protein